MDSRPGRRRPISYATALALATASAALPVLVFAGSASADTNPAAGVPATASAALLPTWQVNGVAWSQVVVGNTVYVTGSFATARPPGVAVGGAGQISAGNIFAYDIRTGDRVASFSHTLNGQGRVITASPDGTKLYVGGDFTTVDGQARGHIASFDVATGALNSYSPSASGNVRAITATNSAVYFGGSFGRVNSSTRNNLAATDASGTLNTTWRPIADATVWSMVLTPDNSRVVIGGSFANLNGVRSYGSGAVSASSGASDTWLANSTIRNDTNGAVGSLHTDGTYIYGTGWAFGSGASFEGAFAADPTDGRIVWLYDCQGDTYDANAIGDVVYTVGHTHDCTMIDSIPDTNPRVRWQHSLAFTKAVKGTNKGPDVYGWNYSGQPAPAMLHWFPTWAQGNASGQSQAAWAIGGDSRYVVAAGEFPSVNGTAQQGLVRFGIGAQAARTSGPTYTTRPATATPTTDAYAIGGGKIRITFGAAWDRDQETLSYQLLRDGNTPVGDPIQAKSNFWTLPTLAAVDPTPPTGAHTYRVRITDPDGNTLTSPTSNSVTAQASFGPYADAILGDTPAHFWRLGDTANRLGTDLGEEPDSLVAGSGVTTGAAGILGTDVASTFSGDGNGVAATRSTSTGRDSFAIEAWFKTTSNSGGKIVGFGNNPGSSSGYDRHLYLTNDGKVTFGVYPGGARTVTSTPGFNDGAWHQVVGNLGPDGMSLWVDGLQIGKDASVTTAQPYEGKWAIGGDSLGGWPDQPSSQYFGGAIDEVSIFNAPLTRAQIRSHYLASGRTLNVPTRPGDTYGGVVYDDEPDFYYRFNDPSTATSAADAVGSSAGKLSDDPQAGRSGAIGYAGDSSFGFDGNRATVATPNAAPAPSVYSEELWFKTNTTRGGKLIGYGDAQSGNSGNYDRHVWMLNNGHLVFGTWTGQTNTIESQDAYNDDTWHHLVANQGPDGMKLYVDGSLVGTNPQTQAQSYDGYWRIGGDTHWGGADSTWFAGDIDEVAVYGKVLSQATIRRHYSAGGGTAPNVKPTAAFTSTVAHKSVDFDGSSSTDSDGTIASYAWDFGDGTTGSGRNAQHVYDTIGTFTVSLTVTDDLGGTHTTEHDVTTLNEAPTASFTSARMKLKVDFDATDSTDSDGSVASYAWQFGDGAAGTGKTTSHTYPAGGSFDVTLTVTDDDGGTHSVTKTVNPVANQAPTASYSFTTSGLSASFDSSASVDPDGSIASRAWDFGDGTSGTGVSPTHAYAASGSYQVKLTVTDNQGATGTLAKTVTVSGPFVTDSFTRNVASGWGDADLGGGWQRAGGTANFRVADGYGQLRMGSAGSGVSVGLSGASSTSTDLTARFRVDKLATGGGQYLYFTGRGTHANGYRAKVRIGAAGAMGVSLGQAVDSTETNGAEAATGLTVVPGTWYRIRLQVFGTRPTTTRVKVWAGDQSEPAAWTATRSDSTASLQGAGGIAIGNYVSGSATNAPIWSGIDDVSARSVE